MQDLQDYPTLNFQHLDTLWLQVTGTLCNLACLHCFISCGPKNDNHPMMSLPLIKDTLKAAATQGTREYYFTGGEPFLHPEIKEIISLTLAQGPLTILTNAILIDDEMASWLAKTFEDSPYSFDLRVSLDGTTPEENDTIRGRGTFVQIIAAIERLVGHGLNPVITVTTCHAELAADEGRQKFIELLKAHNITQPRLKFLMPFKIGRESRRKGGEGCYTPAERLYLEDVPDPNSDHLQCDSCRMVTAHGVWPCPILIEEEGARMSDALEDSLHPIKLNYSACYTCHVGGVSCKT